MGAEREDTDPTAKRTGTEPGLGKASGPTPAAAAAPAVEEDGLEAVDFDALHAALGDPLDYQDMGSGPALEKGNETDDLLEALEPAGEDLPTGPGVRVGESSGRSSATYASARPHTIPPTRAPLEDPNAPAVIVATDTDTVPSAPPQMTVPLAASPHAAKFAAGGLLPGAAPGGAPASNPHIGAAAGSGPQAAAPAHPSSGPHPASPSLGVGHPNTPQAIPVQPRGGPQMTIRMPDRPVNARRGKTPTIVVRPRGPSTKQRLLAFMAMLLLVTACGIAVIIWRKPNWLNLENLGGAPSATTTAPLTPSATLGAPSANSGSGPTITPVTPSSGTTAAGGSASASPSSSASAKKGIKAPPALAPPHPMSSAPSSRL
jgi:hypothetical protein